MLFLTFRKIMAQSANSGPDLIHKSLTQKVNKINSNTMLFVQNMCFLFGKKKIMLDYLCAVFENIISWKCEKVTDHGSI